jgi:uncharacterized protein YsxB (DUF464 family)
MLNVTLNPKEYTFTMTGHAGYAPQGKDIVCSAASILFYTICETVKMIDDEAFEDKPIFNIKDSDNEVTAYIRCKPKEDFTAVLDTIYQTIYNGYELLAEGYPNNVSLTVE